MPLLHWKIMYMLPQYLQGITRLKLFEMQNLQKRLYGKIGQWVEALYKTWNVVT